MRGWRWDLIGNALPQLTLLKLASTVISDEVGVDNWGWMSNDGCVLC